MPVTLTNNTRNSFTVTLYHDLYCKAAGSCKCSASKQLLPSQDINGNTNLRKVDRRYPASVYLAAKGKPGSKVFGLDDAVLQIPQIVVAQKQRKINILLTPKEASPQAPKKAGTAKKRSRGRPKTRR